MAPEGLLPFVLPQQGQTFPNGDTALHAIQDYVLSLKKQVRVKVGGGGRKRLVCSSKSCPMFVQLYKVKPTSSWRIASLDLTHINCTSVAKPTDRQLSLLPCFRSAVIADTAVSAKALVSLVQQQLGIVVSNMSTVYRAKDMVLKDSGLDRGNTPPSQGDANDTVPQLLAKFERLNPGSFTEVQCDDNGNLLRAVVISKVLVDSMPMNQQVLELECAQSTNKSEGLQMVLVARDGNFETLNLAVALVNTESIANYDWFLECLEKTGLSVADYPLLCDQSEALVAVGEKRGLALRHCAVHIERNARADCKFFRPTYNTYLWQLQNARYEEEYHIILSTIGKVAGGEVEAYLRSIPSEEWVLYTTLGKKPLYGWRSTDFVQGFTPTALVEDIRSCTPYAYFGKLMTTMMEAAFTRAQLTAKWAGRLVTEQAEALYSEQRNQMGNYVVGDCQNGVAFVHHISKVPPFQRRVDMERNTCTCAFMDQYRIPCRHMIAALVKWKLHETVWGRFDRCYLVSSYKDAFANAKVEMSLLQNVDNGEELQPTQCPRVKKRKKHTPSQGEKSSPRRARLCSKCKKPGHNIRSCTNPPAC